MNTKEAEPEVKASSQKNGKRTLEVLLSDSGSAKVPLSDDRISVR